MSTSSSRHAATTSRSERRLPSAVTNNNSSPVSYRVTTASASSPKVIRGATACAEPGAISHRFTRIREAASVTNNYNVFVGFKVRDPYEGYILTDSVVRVGAGDLLGARSLEVTRGRAGLPTVKMAKDQPLLMLSDAFRYEPSLTNRTYVPLDRAKNGFWLSAEESFPIQQRLTEIANSVNAALPGIFGLTNQVVSSLRNLDLLMLSLRDTLPKVEGLMADVRGTLKTVDPLLRTPGGIGDLLVPTNLNTQLTTTLSNLNPGTGPIGLTLSNLNLRMADVGMTLSNVNQQLQSNTNLLRDTSLVSSNVASLASTLETLFKRHWLFRSAYRTNAPESPKAPRRPTRTPKDSPSPAP